jgi:3-dehydroquinate synthase
MKTPALVRVARNRPSAGSARKRTARIKKRRRLEIENRKSKTVNRVRVPLGPRSYEIAVVTRRADLFGAFLRQALERTWAGSACRRALVVTDANLAELGLPAAYQAALSGAGIEPAMTVLPAGERTKSLRHLSGLYDELVSHKADRHTLIVALGGGVIGDLAGFLAATFARGLPLLMIPTTLLAQVDSSVGGKVGINHPAAKNAIGAFHQPIGVWIDTETLGTLPARELRCGLAEVVKYGVILDSDFFATLERIAEDLLGRDDRALRHVVTASCRLKAGVVSRDEREETGLRAVLNFGHTIGHAIEAVAGYGGLYQHGEAVAVGMVAENRLAERLGYIGADVTARLVRLLERMGLPTSAPGLDPDRLLDAIARDKKNRDGKLRFVLPRSIGAVELTGDAGVKDVRSILEDL